MRFRRALILLPVLLLVAASPERAALNARVFDKAWTLVDRDYWDRGFGGADWAALRVRYRPEAMGAGDDAALYATLNAMLKSIGDSHVYARSPAELKAEAAPELSPHVATPIEGDMLLLRFDSFAKGDDRWIAERIAQAKPRAVVLDLRHNRGGRDDMLDRIAGLFVAEDRLILRLRGRRTTEEWSDGPRRGRYVGPLFVLVSGRTASAAELLAAFVDREGRAQTVGVRTKGAVTAGKDYDLPGGGRLTVAVRDVLLPDGSRIEHVGLAPRHVVAERPNEDAPLACAIILAHGGAACPASVE